MARRLRSSPLETRTARLKLKVRRKPYFVSVAPSISLGYRRNLGPGTWLVRCADGKGGSWSQAFAHADDFEDVGADASVLDYWAAQTRAKELVRGPAGDANKPITVRQALDDYERDLIARGGLLHYVHRLRRILPPAILDRPVSLLASRELRHWRDGRLARGLAPGTVARECKQLKAALNYARSQDPDNITNRSAWDVGLKSPPDSGRARTDTVLDADTIGQIVCACHRHSNQLGRFIEVLATCGCRPVQAARLLVGDLERNGVQLPRSAKGKGKRRIDRRFMPLPASLLAKLRAAAGNRPVDAPLLLRADGEAWQTGHSDHTRPFAAALVSAGLERVIPYSLRHSSIVRALMRGVSPQIVADSHDTSLPMLQKHYARYIADHATEAVRAAQLDFSAPPPDDTATVVPLRR